MDGQQTLIDQTWTAIEKCFNKAADEAIHQEVSGYSNKAAPTKSRDFRPRHKVKCAMKLRSILNVASNNVNSPVSTNTIIQYNADIDKINETTQSNVKGAIHVESTVDKQHSNLVQNNTENHQQ